MTTNIQRDLAYWSGLLQSMNALNNQMAIHNSGSTQMKPFANEKVVESSLYQQQPIINLQQSTSIPDTPIAILKPSTQYDEDDTIELDEFDGHTSWFRYQTHLELIALVNGWDITTKAKQLIGSLRGEALEAVKASKISMKEMLNYNQLIKILEERFGGNNKFYQTEFGRSIQQSNQIINEHISFQTIVENQQIVEHEEFPEVNDELNFISELEGQQSQQEGTSTDINLFEETTNSEMSAEPETTATLCLRYEASTEMIVDQEMIPVAVIVNASSTLELKSTETHQTNKCNKMKTSSTLLKHLGTIRYKRHRNHLSRKHHRLKGWHWQQIRRWQTKFEVYRNLQDRNIRGKTFRRTKRKAFSSLVKRLRNIRRKKHRDHLSRKHHKLKRWLWQQICRWQTKFEIYKNLQGRNSQCKISEFYDTYKENCSEFDDEPDLKHNLPLVIFSN